MNKVQRNQVAETSPRRNQLPPIVRGAFYKYRDSDVYIMSQIDLDGPMVLISLNEGNRYLDTLSKRCPFGNETEWRMLPPNTVIEICVGMEREKGC
jgi:hypothetical protein